MMTRREKLLVRPWQLRRYNNHKKKVLNAVPVIDFGPPPQRRHVTVKLKKLQKEKERQMKIEEDNFKLLQHLGSIMSKKRVDNCWETEPPTFLRRVGIYHRSRSPSPCVNVSSEVMPGSSSFRKSRCPACTPQREQPLVVPEERVPWELPKKVLTCRQSGSATVPVVSDFDFPSIKNIQNGSKTRIKKLPIECKTRKSADRLESGKKLLVSKTNFELPTICSDKRFANGFNPAMQSVVLRQGSLQIALNFPSFAEVKLVRGKGEKFLQTNYCQCKGFRALK